ncbi:protein kinase family protein [Bacillales bacterium AN1005]
MQSGTGDAHLFKDETTDMLFAFKKHPNIVRVYNYYLYPEVKLGYLQMEYIDGVTIADYKPSLYGKKWVEIFAETIDAFKYLEINNILHRDIRPANIMIDKDENVKVIDFSFGKKLSNQDKEGRSVFLNWPVTQLPNEMLLEGIYNHQSEIYFVGKLFSSILKENIADFKFKHIIDKMVKVNPHERYSSFHEISVDISPGSY